MNEHDKHLIHRSHDEAMAQGKLDIIPEIYAENFENHSGGLPDFLRNGHSAIQAHYNFLRSAFSEIEIVNNIEIIEGDLMGIQWTWHATHSGEFLGIPATNARVQIDGMEIIRVENGRIVEAWIVQDNPSLMAQLQAAAPAGAVQA